jgi:hypothetical protein
LIGVLFFIVFSSISTDLFGASEGTIASKIPIIICCLLFLIPMFKIYTKEPMKKDSSFFEKKLG